ncbi:MAG: hypothetical protein IPL78_34615 [Chloroflexi bacterium]|nr:hypothetical protein [Chloroflexota bacterium]
MTVDDGNGQPVSSLVVIRVYNRQERIRVPQYRFLYAPGETFSVEAIVETIDGEPVRGRTLTADLSRYNRTTHSYDTLYTASGLTTDERGRATHSTSLSIPPVTTTSPCAVRTVKAEPLPCAAGYTFTVPA